MDVTPTLLIKPYLQFEDKEYMRPSILLFSILCLCNGLVAQLPTYTIDNSFNSDELFRAAGSVNDFHFLEDGRILVGGGFHVKF